MEIYKAIQNIKEKYNLNFDLNKYNDEYYYRQIADQIIGETKFLNKLVQRTKVGIPTFTVKARLPLNNWYLFQELINDYSNNFCEKLEHIIMLACFVDGFFYVDNSWEKEKAEKLKEIIDDEELNKLFKYWLGKECRSVLNETSYYYKDEVWNIVKDLFKKD